MSRNRFKVNEFASGFEVEDTTTGKTHWMSDGVDVLTTPTGKSMCPGSEYFRKTWEKSLNVSSLETEEAYFGSKKMHK